MTIGTTWINTDDMSIAELKECESMLHKIRKRREEAEEFKARMNTIITEATEAGFVFFDNETGFERTENDFIIFDMRM